MSAKLLLSPARSGCTRILAAIPAVVPVTLAALPFFLGGYALHLAVSGGLMAVAAMALTVISGAAGLPSLGTAAFLAIGAFTSGVLATQWGLGLLPAVLVSAALGLLTGVLIAALTLRASGLYLAVGTLALQNVVHVVATDLDLKLTFAAGFTLDNPDLFGMKIDTLEKWWSLVLVLLALTYGLFRSLLRSHVGREWSLLRVHPGTAAALGIFGAGSRIEVFAVTSAVIAIVGALRGYQVGNVQADTYTVQLAVVYLTVAALGGAGNLPGAIAASYLIVLLPDFITAGMTLLSIDATSRAAGLESVAIGVILIFALLRGPQRLGAWLAHTKVPHAGR
jgi:branched-chain amino acid transport system permease protein